MLNQNPADTKIKVEKGRTALFYKMGGTGHPSQDTPEVLVCLCLALPMARFRVQQ